MAINRAGTAQLLVAAALSLVGFSAIALQPGDRVDNFRLLDHLGQSHELYRYADAKAVVVMVQDGGCQSSAKNLARFARLRGEYSDQGVDFLMINSSAGSTRASIAADAKANGIAVPILLDSTQIIGEGLDLATADELLVVNPQGWTLAYRGDIKEKYAGKAIDAVVAGAEVVRSSTRARGCAINFPEKSQHAEHARISYSDTIAPMLADNCVSCHRQGGIGPWAMSDYNMVRGFAPMIREVVRTQRMPPWHADPHFGEFDNDRSLTPDELKTLVHWIEAGAPRGKGDDPLADYKHNWPEWALGEPDLVVQIPAQEVPASGTVEYQYRTIANPLDRDVWVRAAEILPGDRSALHHVITSFAVPGPDGKIDRRTSGSLGGYVPGATADVFPAGTGVLLPAGAVLRLQLHYTTYGMAAVDHSRLGLYFHDTKPAHALHNAVLMNTKIKIPAGVRHHADSASQLLERDVLVHSLLPHAHYRGKASEFRAVYPDGEEEVLLSVPNYDFNWQTSYELASPKVLPAGTRIVHTTAWDNSTANPANPDPTRTVPWGQQSWDEMLFGAVSFRYLDDSETPGDVVAGQAVEPATNDAGD